jgi:hypothetical protein
MGERQGLRRMVDGSQGPLLLVHSGDVRQNQVERTYTGDFLDI